MNFRNSVSRQERNNGHYSKAWNGHPYKHGQYAAPQNVPAPGYGMEYYPDHMYPYKAMFHYGAGKETFPGSQQVLPQYPPQYMPLPPTPYTPYPTKKTNSFNPFDNPLQPIQAGAQPHIANPYPKQQFLKKPHPSGFQSVLNQFKLQDGSVDINKMMNTAGQVMNTFSQVSAIVKGFGGKLKV